VLYLPSLDFPFVWEDEGAIAAGTLLRPEGQTLAAFGEPLHRIENRGASARQAYYRPLPVVALSLVDQQLGREPRNFRALTIAAGALCAAAFGAFAGFLFGRAGPALFAALFAALHPVGIETTVWIAGVPATISTLFMIGALAFALAATRAASRRTAVLWGALSAASLVLALLSKEQAAVTPALLVAALLSLGTGSRRGTAVRLVLLQTLLVGVYFLALRPVVLGSALTGVPPIDGSMTTQLLTAIASWPRQLGWLFAPLRSSTSDTVKILDSLASPRLALGLALALGSAFAWWWLRRAGAQIAAFALAWIWIAFAPTSGLLPLLHASGERYLFLSSFGAALLLAGLGMHWLPVQPPAWRRRLAPALALLVLFVLAERTRTRLPAWSSTETLFKIDLARAPNFREAYFMLGVKAAEAGRFAEASERIAPLLSNDARFQGTAGYLNWLSLAELACLSSLGRQDFADVLALEARWQRELPAVARAPGFRVCAAQARDGLGRTAEAVETYLAVAGELGAAAPTGLYIAIARDLAALGRGEEARPWLQRARDSAPADAAVLAQVQAIESALAR
jgi:tetratricopeptide (TPR) repeat protein